MKIVVVSLPISQLWGLYHSNIHTLTTLQPHDNPQSCSPVSEQAHGYIYIYILFLCCVFSRYGLTHTHTQISVHAVAHFLLNVGLLTVWVSYEEAERKCWNTHQTRVDKEKKTVPVVIIVDDLFGYFSMTECGNQLLHSSDALLWRCHDDILKPFLVPWLSPHPEVSWKSVAKSDGQAWLATTDLCRRHFPFLFSSSFTFSFIPSLSLVAFTFPTPLSVMTHCSCHCHDNRFGCSHGLWSVFTWLLVCGYPDVQESFMLP